MANVDSTIIFGTRTLVNYINFFISKAVCVCMFKMKILRP